MKTFLAVVVSLVIGVAVAQEDVVRRGEGAERHPRVEHHAQLWHLQRRVHPSHRDASDGVGACLHFGQHAAQGYSPAGREVSRLISVFVAPRRSANS